MERGSERGSSKKKSIKKTLHRIAAKHKSDMVKINRRCDLIAQSVKAFIATMNTKAEKNAADMALLLADGCHNVLMQTRADHQALQHNVNVIGANLSIRATESERKNSVLQEQVTTQLSGLRAEFSAIVLTSFGSMERITARALDRLAEQYENADKVLQVVMRGVVDRGVPMPVAPVPGLNVPHVLPDGDAGPAARPV